MDNIINYVENELHTISEKPFNPVDSLVLSQICYINFGSLVGHVHENKKHITFKDLLKTECFPKMFDSIPYGTNTKALLFALAASPRFRDIRINYYISKTDSTFEKQFSAITFILNNTAAYIAFRGTDYTVVGWKEDFNMAFTSPVPSQIEGVNYLNTIAKIIPHDLYIGGHSKGGNIAVYSAMNCNYRISTRIKSIYSHDGPGFRKEIIQSDKFNSIKDKIHKTLPHSSLIGMLLENHEDYHVIKSNKFGGLKQHNPFSWEISNCDFNYLEKISSSAQYTNDTLNKWLSEVDDNKRKILINTLFDILNSTSSKSFIELSQNRKKNIPIIISAIKNMDAELKSMIIELIKELSSLYLKNLAPHEKSNMSDFKKSFISHLSSK